MFAGPDNEVRARLLDAGGAPKPVEADLGQSVGCLRKPVDQVVKMLRLDELGVQERHGILISEARSGQAAEHAERGPVAPILVKAHPWQKPCRADIRKQADPGLGHGEHRPLGHDAVAAMDRDADPAPHHHPVHQPDIGLGIAFDLGVQAVFVGEEAEVPLAGAPALTVLVECADVAAGGEGLAAGATDRDDLDGIVLGPGVELFLQCQHHGIGQRVQRLRAVQRDKAQPPAALEQDLCVIHVSCPPVPRRASFAI